MGLGLTAPWALVGLVALPLIWWLQKRLRRPPDVEVPSLMFLLDEDDARALPRGRRFDAELMLALAAAALLALAAAGPVLGRRAPQAVVRVAISGGGPAARQGYRADVEATLAALREAVGEATIVETAWVGDLADGPRPTPAALLATALAGEASRRFVLSDVEGPEDLGGVRWLVLGREGPRNTGIVSASVLVDGPAPALFLTLAHQGAAHAAGRVALVGDAGERTAPFRVAPEGFTSLTVPLAGLGARVAVRLEGAGGGAWQDDLAADDALALERGPLRVAIADLPDPLAARVRHGLAAALGEDGWVEAGDPVLAFGAPGPALHGGGLPRLFVTLATAPPDAATQAAPAGPMRVRADPLVRDLAAAGGDFVFTGDRLAAVGDAVVLLARVHDGRTWPVVTRRGRVVDLVPDPLRGAPPLVDTPFWPLFLANVVDATGQAGLGGGWRGTGLLDAASSLTSRRRDVLAAGSLADLPPARPGDRRSLRPPLIVGALACLLLLWAAPRLRQRFARAKAAKLHARRGAAA